MAKLRTARRTSVKKDSAGVPKNGRRKVPFVEYRAASHRDLLRQKAVFENRRDRAAE
jgi:hypothetical protein